MGFADPKPVMKSPKKLSKYWIILADTQLGAIHWQNPTRERDYYEAFQSQCLAAAKDKNCLGIIGLGDLRERASIQPRNLGGLCRGLEILAQAQKPLLAIMGNHDFSDPNWIEEMCYPSLKNFADPIIQDTYGFDPEESIVLHYMPKSKLKEKLLEFKAEKIKNIFLHQSLKEFSVGPGIYETSLEELQGMGFGKEHPCQIFLGDIHNYGDTSLGNLQAVYPGSLEMTDINEGRNGLKSNRIPSGPHDYRKFVLHYDPISHQWEPYEICPRPWFRLKAKTEKEAFKEWRLLEEIAQSWEKPGMLAASLPKEFFSEFLQRISSLPLLQYKLEEYNLQEEESQETDICVPNTISWSENKSSLLQLARAENLETCELQLLEAIVHSDNTSHNPKNDVLGAWEKWVKEQETQKENEIL